MEEKEKIINVSVEDILPNRFQPRLAFNEEELNALSSSIRKYGVLQPILLRKIGDKYEIIAGERRYKATVQAGLKTIPAIIKESDDNTSAEIALLENLQRKNLTVIEEAQSFKKLMDKGFTQEEIANKMGISQSSIANKLRLLNLPRKIQDALLFNKISERHARSLLSLNDQELQENLLDKIINERLTVKQTEDEINKILHKDEEEDDIPQEIRKYINREEETFKNDKPRIQEIQEENEDINPFQEENEKNNINPFQVSFQDNIRKIEEELDSEKEEGFYDKIINNDFNKNKFDYLENIINEKDKKNNKDIPSIISKVRNFVNNFDKEYIHTEEEDLPDKYRIVIEINKED